MKCSCAHLNELSGGRFCLTVEVVTPTRDGVVRLNAAGKAPSGRDGKIPTTGGAGLRRAPALNEGKSKDEEDERDDARGFEHRPRPAPCSGLL